MSLFDGIEKITLLGRNIQVQKAATIAADADMLGSWQIDFNKIIIQDKKFCDDQTYDITFLHEIWHAVFDLIGEGEISNNEKRINRITEISYQLYKQFLEQSQEDNNERNKKGHHKTKTGMAKRSGKNGKRVKSKKPTN